MGRSRRCSCPRRIAACGCTCASWVESCERRACSWCLRRVCHRAPCSASRLPDCRDGRVPQAGAAPSVRPPAPLAPNARCSIPTAWRATTSARRPRLHVRHAGPGEALRARRRVGEGGAQAARRHDAAAGRAPAGSGARRGVGVVAGAVARPGGRGAPESGTRGAASTEPRRVRERDRGSARRCSIDAAAPCCPRTTRPTASTTSPAC